MNLIVASPDYVVTGKIVSAQEEEERLLAWLEDYEFKAAENL